MEHQEKRGLTVLSSFILKVLAMLFMTFDHIGWMMYAVGGNATFADVLRVLGRFALPLFCFMIVEGVIHTKKPERYFRRLGLMAILISLVLFVVECAPDELGISLYSEGNIFIDLLLGAVTVYLLRQNDWKKKALIIFPIAFSTLSFIVNCLEYGNNELILWFPFFARPQYGFYSIFMIVLFYFTHPLTDLFLRSHSQKSGIPYESLKGTYMERYSLNIMSLGAVIIATLTYFLISVFIGPDFTFWTEGMQNAAIISGVFLLLYNGKRGYNAKWFQYGSYLYYPLHMLIIFGIGYLVLIL